MYALGWQGFFLACSLSSIALTLHYGLLQALAFNEEYDFDTEFVDKSAPDYEKIHVVSIGKE